MQIIYLVKDLNLEYMKNSQNAIIRKQCNIKNEQEICVDTAQKRYTSGKLLHEHHQSYLLTKITMKYRYSSSRMAKIRKIDNTSVGGI